MHSNATKASFAAVKPTLQATLRARRQRRMGTVDPDLLATVLRVHMQSRLRKAQQHVIVAQAAPDAVTTTKPMHLVVSRLQAALAGTHEPQVRAQLAADRPNYGFDAALRRVRAHAQLSQQH